MLLLADVCRAVLLEEQRSADLQLWFGLQTLEEQQLQLFFQGEEHREEDSRATEQQKFDPKATSAVNVDTCLSTAWEQPTAPHRARGKSVAAHSQNHAGAAQLSPQPSTSR